MLGAKKLVSYMPLFDQWETLHAQEVKAKIDRLKVYKRAKYIVDPPKQNQISSGEERFNKFEWYLENGFKWKRHIFQKEFHKMAAMVLAPQIIGATDWDRVGPLLAKQRKWTMQRNSKMLLGKHSLSRNETKSVAFVGRGPRRFGKSVAESMLAAAYALVVARSVQSIFSTAQRIAQYLGELVYQCLCQVKNRHYGQTLFFIEIYFFFLDQAGFEKYIKKFGEEKMEMYGSLDLNENDIRKVFYYPANAKIDATAKKRG